MSRVKQFASLIVAMVLVLTLFLGVGATVMADPDNDGKINEFVCNHTDADEYEFVEFFGEVNTDYSGYSIIEIEGDYSSSTNAEGVIEGVWNVGTTDSGGFWVTDFMYNELENGTLTLLLVENFTEGVGYDLDTNDDGVLDSTPWSSVIDEVAFSDGGSSDIAYSAVVLIKPLWATTAGGFSRIPNGLDTDSATDWVLNDFDGAGLPPEFTNTHVPTPVCGEAYNTPGETNRLVCQICGYKYLAGTADGLGGWEINLEVLEGSWSPCDTTTTDAEGAYFFAITTAGQYRVTESLKAGWTAIPPYSHEVVILPEGNPETQYDFYNEPPPTVPSPTQPPAPGGEAVGVDVFTVDKMGLIAPWITLGVILLAGGMFLVRRKAHSNE